MPATNPTAIGVNEWTANKPDRFVQTLPITKIVATVGGSNARDNAAGLFTNPLRERERNKSGAAH